MDDKIGMNVDGVAQMGDTEKDSSERVKDVVPTTRTWLIFYSIFLVRGATFAKLWFWCSSLIPYN